MNKQFLNEAGLQSVADNVNKRLKTVETMPANPKSEQVVLYTGATSGDFVQGHIYEYNSETYYCYIAEDGGYYYHFYIKEIEAGATVYACGSPEWFQKKADSISELTSDFSEIGYTFSITAASPSSITVSNGGLSIVAGRSSDDDLSNVGWTDITSSGTVDLSFNPISSNAQSGVAVNEAKAVLFNKLFKIDTWNNKSWSGEGDYRGFAGSYVWKDGDNIYMSSSDGQDYNFVLNKATSTWESKTWNGLTQFNGYYIWSDGTNIYYSSYATQYVLNRATSTWEEKTWNGLTNFNAENIWIDGDNIYYSYGSTQYVLNKSTSTWEEKTWQGLTDFYGQYIWTDDMNIYYSNGSRQYILNKATSTWEEKTWNGMSEFNGNYIWTDGNNTYYSWSHMNYILDKATSTWGGKTWYGWDEIDGEQGIWTDGSNVYYSNGSDQYILTKTLKTYID